MWFAATCYREHEFKFVLKCSRRTKLAELTAFRSLSTSLMFLHPELPGYFAGSSTICLYSPSLSNTPSRTILKLRMCAPSSKIVVDVGGIDPGRIPPMSAWCPRDAVKKITRAAAASKTGEMIVMSGRCEPPARGEFVMSTSPGLSVGPCSCIWYFTALRVHGGERWKS